MKLCGKKKTRKNTWFLKGAILTWDPPSPPRFLGFRSVRNTPPHLVAAGGLGGLVAGWWVGWLGWLGWLGWAGWLVGWLGWLG